MSLAIQNGTLIDQNWLNTNRNTDEKSFGERYLDFSGKAVGAVRTLQVIKGVATLTPSPLAADLARNSGIAIGGLGIVRLPSLAKDAITAVTNLSKDNGATSERKMGIAIRDTMDAVTGWGNSASFVLNIPAIRTVTQFTDLTTDVADFGLSVSDYSQAAEYEDVAVGDVKKAFTHTKNYLMLRIAKAIASIVIGVLAILMFLTGAQLLPTVAMVLLAMTTAALAIRRDIFKDEGEYRVISFDTPVRV